MRVMDVIRMKGNRVVAVPPHAKLRDVAKRLAAEKVGSVAVVEPDGTVLGLVSEKALIEALAREGVGCVEREAREVMTAPPPGCQAGDTIRAVMEDMTRERNRHLLVWNGDELVGIVSVGDLVKARVSDTEMENLVLRDVAAARIVARV